MTVWHDASIKRPPQNRILLWAHYGSMLDGSYDGPGFNVGTYRFGLVEGPGSRFSIPPKEADRRQWDRRLLWAEIDRPEPTHFMVYDPEFFDERFAELNRGDGVEVLDG